MKRQQNNQNQLAFPSRTKQRTKKYGFFIAIGMHYVASIFQSNMKKM